MTHRFGRLATVGVAAAMLVAAASVRTAAQGKSGGAGSASLPAAVSRAISDNKPGAEIDKLEIEKEHGINVYDIEFKAGKGEIEVTEDGTVIEVTDIIELKDAPEAVATTIRTAAKGRTIKQVEKAEVRSEIVKNGDKGGISKLSTPKYVYEAELDKGEIEVASDGTLIKAGK
jgi:hypothetical protein